jgi:two-component system chemotaxis response regulator CheB
MMLTARGEEEDLVRALELGAVDFVAKPKIGISQGLQEATAEIIEKIRVAARARITRQGAAPRPVVPSAAPGHTPANTAPRSNMPLRQGTEKLIAIGSSTGGTEAVRVVLTQLPADCPAVVITQHMPPGFTRSFADRLDTLCRIRVKEAENGERLLPGHAYIAPGGHHLRVDRSGANYVAVIDEGEPINRHRPSVEALFDSVARKAGPNAVGVMLTGMGRDGADAMRRMHDAGAWNIAQDEASCVVFGMPREAIAAGGVDEVVTLSAIGQRVLERLRATGGLSNRV